MNIDEIVKFSELVEKQCSLLKKCIRNEMDAILIGTDEKHPLECYIPFGETPGLNSLQLPTIIKAYQIPTEGSIYFIIDEYDKPIEFNDEIFSLSDLVLILKLLKNEQ